MLLWEVPLWLILLYASLMPSRLSPSIEISQVPIGSSELCLIAGAVFYSFAALLMRRPKKNGDRFALGLALLMPLLIGYAWVSSLWSGLEQTDATAMRYTLLAAWGASALGYAVLSPCSPEWVRGFLWRLTIFLALTSLVYSAESVLSLGLRSKSAQHLLTDFGIQRVKGPLFGASTGHFILIPAIAFALQKAIDTPASRPLSIPCALSLMTGLLGSGARAALLILSVFMFSLSFLVNKPRKRILAITLSAGILTIAGVIIFSEASVTRFRSFEDNARRNTHLAAWHIVTEGDLAEQLLGRGYGSIWPWYNTDAWRGDRIAGGDNMVRSASGDRSLYHPHSTFLLLGVELGLPGLLFFVFLWVMLIRVVVRSRRNGACQIFACGVASSGLAMFFDLFVFKNWKVSAVWWLFAIGAVAVTSAARRQKLGIVPVRSFSRAVPRRRTSRFVSEWDESLCNSRSTL